MTTRESDAPSSDAPSSDAPSSNAPSSNAPSSNATPSEVTPSEVTPSPIHESQNTSFHAPGPPHDTAAQPEGESPHSGRTASETPEPLLAGTRASTYPDAAGAVSEVNAVRAGSRTKRLHRGWIAGMAMGGVLLFAVVSWLGMLLLREDAGAGRSVAARGVQVARSLASSSTNIITSALDPGQAAAQRAEKKRILHAALAAADTLPVASSPVPARDRALETEREGSVAGQRSAGPPSSVSLPCAASTSATGEQTALPSQHASTTPHASTTSHASTTPHASTSTQPAGSTPRVVPFSGRTEIDVLLIGIDARLGRTQTRADAIHLLTIDLRRGDVHITSIPRGTHVPLGFAQPSGNIISHVRSMRGRDALLRTVGSLCGRAPVQWYIEVGFSQAVGILELLGYADPMVELQALRKRKGYQQGDRNRSWNQGEFIRRSILRSLPLFEGAAGELLLDAGMVLVDTNIPRDVALGLVYSLGDAGLATHPERLTHALHGSTSTTYARLTEGGDSSRAVPNGRYEAMQPTVRTRAETVLRERIAHATRQERNPRAVCSTLWQIAQQRGWLQIPDKAVRYTLRDSLVAVLRRALVRLDDSTRVMRLREIVRTDDQLFRSAAATWKTSAGSALPAPAPKPSTPPQGGHAEERGGRETRSAAKTSMPSTSPASTRH